MRIKQRQRHVRVVCTIGAALLVAACATPPTVVDEGTLPPALPDGVARLAAPGPYEFIAQDGVTESSTGCTVSYTHFLPGGSGNSDDPLLVLAHGFLRTKENMRGWAELFASHGIRTVSVSFCNSSLLNGNHEQNATDLRLVADQLAGEQTPVFYAGYSAGGLSAAIAAAADTRTFGYLGIDPVESGGLMAEIDKIDSPALYLLGVPNACNRDGATRPVLPPASPAWLIEVPFATHCTFEDPTDQTCIRLCGGVTPESANAQLRQIIQGIGTLFVSAQFGTDPLAFELLTTRQLRSWESDGVIRIIDPQP
jgi:dienelactone hydrolase